MVAAGLMTVSVSCSDVEQMKNYDWVLGVGTRIYINRVLCIYCEHSAGMLRIVLQLRIEVSLLRQRL
jgi:hypothetical protein